MSKGNWYANSYRKLFFDFHSHSLAVGLASAFDADRWAQRLEKANAQAVSIFVKGGRGWSSYRRGSVRHVHPQLPEGLDMLEEQLQALHKRGIRAIGYYHTFGSEAVAQDHPDWVVRNADGAPAGNSICMLGPLLEEHMLPHVREVLENYELDALFFDGARASHGCFCDSCRESFGSETGAEIPTDDSDPIWSRYIAWRLETFRQIRERISEVIHSIRPDMPVSYNWAYAMNMPEPVPDHVGNLVIDVQPDDQAFQGSYQARYWATLGLPFDIMNSAFLQWWGDWGSKPAAALQQEVATVIANGGLTWIGYQMTHTFDVQPAVMEQMGKALAFVKEREYLLKDAEPIPNVAVFNSTANHFAGGKARSYIDEVHLRGAHRLFMEAAIPHHFVHEKALLEHLEQYRAVVFPDARHVPSEMVPALERYVQNGGVLLATYRTGTEDGTGQKQEESVLSDLLGIRLEGDYEVPQAYVEVTDTDVKEGVLDMPHLVHGRFAFARPQAADVETVARLRKLYTRADGQFLLTSSPVGEDSDYPAITRRRLGNGMAIYVAGQVFRGYQTHNQWCLKPIMANLLNDAIGQPLVQLDSPAWLEVALMRQGDRVIVHLVNFHGNRPFDRNNVCVEQILPVRGIELKLALESRPAKVHLEPGGAEPRCSYADGILHVAIPEVQIHCAVVVESA